MDMKHVFLALVLFGLAFAGSSDKDLVVTYKMVCPDNSFEVTVHESKDDKLLSNVNIRMVKVSPWEGTVAEGTTEAGVITFDGLTAGGYELYAVKPEYKRQILNIDIEMCEEAPEEENVTEETPPAEEYEEDEVVDAPPKEEEEVTEESDELSAATKAIADADAAITKANAEGEDTTEARAKLQEAQQHLMLGDPVKAKQLADEAKAMVTGAALPVEEEEEIEELPPVEEEEEMETVEEEEEEMEEAADYSLLAIVVLVVLVVVAYWYYSQEPKKKKKK